MKIESPVIRTKVCSVVLLLLLLLPRRCHYCVFGFDNIRLTTRAKNPLGNAAALQDYLSRPIHWPEIVASSDKVESSSVNNPPPLPSSPSFDVNDSMLRGKIMQKRISRSRGETLAQSTTAAGHGIHVGAPGKAAAGVCKEHSPRRVTDLNLQPDQP